jgi:glucose-6-phosphate 1-dehydrogenase
MSAIIQVEPLLQTTVSPLPKADACILVIFGASGDLTRRKLIPALYDLSCVGCISGSCFDIVGVGRTQMTTEQFRASMRESAANVRDLPHTTPQCWESFEQRLQYFAGDPNDPAFYPRLGAHLNEMHQNWASPNHLFYVSTPASVAEPIVRGLGAAGLARNDHGWTRIVLEKPFGRDLASARELNKMVLEVFPEESIYRIDHYLGKETVQNILVFRFGNALYEPVWNRNYVDYIEITAAETVGVESRAAFYEETGALRDMVANHLLQLLALTAMEAPVAFDADSVREQKVQVFRSIRPMTIDEVARSTVRGQYGPGIVDGVRVPGYREEHGISAHSNTETFAAVEFFIDNWRWAGVPFFIRTGKRLPKQSTEVRVHFKRTPQALFARTPEDAIPSNVITLRIQPNEGISIEFAAKHPGSQMSTIPVQANFSYASFGSPIAPAYETLLLDAMRGDATLFTRRDEVEAEWRIITPIEDAWGQLPAPEFPNYAAGTDGPIAANNLIEREDHRAWKPISTQLAQAA